MQIEIPGEEQYWNNRYYNNQTGWDIGYVSTPVKEYANQLSNKNISILIPGCGNAYEAEYLLKIGFENITLIDISTTLVNKLNEKFAGKKITILHQNFFEHDHQYDLIIEQTFFCSLHPSLRKLYVKKIIELLKPGGILAGVLFNREFNGGPPFGGNEKEYKELFCKHFSKCLIQDCYNSIAPRKGTELFIRLTK